MKCPICGSLNTTVMDSRPEGNTRMRRLRCLDCGETFKTCHDGGTAGPVPDLQRICEERNGAGRDWLP